MLPLGFFCVFLKDAVHFLQGGKEDPAKCTKNGKTENELKNMKKIKILLGNIE